MIIVLGSQKGGVGKSTLAVSIAAYLMSLGNRVMIIVDADDQKSVLTGTTIVLKIFPIFRLLAQQATSKPC